MGAGMVELVTLEIDLGAAQMRGEPFGKIERTGSAHIVAQVARHLGRKSRITLGVRIGFFERENERHQRLGHETPPNLPKWPRSSGPARNEFNGVAIVMRS